MILIPHCPDGSSGNYANQVQRVPPALRNSFGNVFQKITIKRKFNLMNIQTARYSGDKGLIKSAESNF
jgi:hypothetical protein